MRECVLSKFCCERFEWLCCSESANALPPFPFFRFSTRRFFYKISRPHHMCGGFRFSVTSQSGFVAFVFAG